MKSTAHFTTKGHAPTPEADQEGLLILLTILLGEIIIIDVMGL